MFLIRRKWGVLLAGLMILGACHSPSVFQIPPNSKGPVVVMSTTSGDIYIELYPEQAPISTSNFMEYVRSGFYDNTIFHRVIDDLLIQGGGYSVNMIEKETNTPLVEEADNGLSNKRGTVAFAWNPSNGGCTSQFFINLKDNQQFDHQEDAPPGTGYAVFGKVIKGLNVIDMIGTASTGEVDDMENVPLERIVIRQARILSDTW